MKNTFYKTTVYTVLLFCFLGFSSCKEKDPSLELRLGFSEVSGDEDDQFLRIITDSEKEWVITVDPGGDWCFVEPTRGVGGALVIVSTSENGTQENRTATINVQIGNTQRSVDLTQEPAVLLDVVGNAFVSEAATTLPLEIITKSFWAASITSGGNFARVSPDRGNGNGTINVQFDAYTGTTRRTANLRVTGSGQTLDITLTQGLTSSRPEQEIPFRIELPEVKNRRWFVDHTFWAMEYDTAQRHAVWIAFVFNNAYNQKNTSRTNAWAFDPIIPREFQSLNSTSQTFSQWGYDRGHIMASEHRVFSDAANRTTFYYSNMSPQVSWFNQQLWQMFERTVRFWARAADCDTLYVVKGAAINKAGTTYTVNGVERVFAGAEIIRTLPDRNHVTVPRWWFAALVRRKGDSFDGIAFWMENTRNHPSNRPSHAAHSITIRELEHRTGINFFPNLKYAVPGQPGLEEAVETTRDTTRWPIPNPIPNI
jgi:endonuclease G